VYGGAHVASCVETSVEGSPVAPASVPLRVPLEPESAIAPAHVSLTGVGAQSMRSTKLPVLVALKPWTRRKYVSPAAARQATFEWKGAPCTSSFTVTHASAPQPPARALAPGQAEGPAAAEGPSTGSPAGGSTWAPPPAGALLQPLGQAFPTLTPRQLEVLGALARGLANKQIARELGISEGTVKQHVNAILFELGVSNRTEAVYLLARLGIGLG